MNIAYINRRVKAMTVSLMGFRLGGDDGKDAMVLTDGVCCQ